MPKFSLYEIYPITNCFDLSQQTDLEAGEGDESRIAAFQEDTPGDEQHSSGGGHLPDYTNMTELELLKKRKGDLEEQLGQLQDSRRDLIVHLDELMQRLRVRFTMMMMMM